MKILFMRVNLTLRNKVYLSIRIEDVFMFLKELFTLLYRIQAA